MHVDPFLQMDQYSFGFGDPLFVEIAVFLEKNKNQKQ
jgi:hypothetical protein